MDRIPKRTVKIGSVAIGGDNRVAIQSMTTAAPSDVDATVKEIAALEEAGCDIARFCVRDFADAAAVKEIKKRTRLPLVADVHFDYRLAIAAVDAGADKVRVNPGNLGGEAKIAEVAAALRANGVPVRVGANSGSIEKEFLEKYGRSELALGESALRSAAAFEKYGVANIVVSVKASSVPLNVRACRYVAAKCDYPLHVGVTEAGVLQSGIVKNSVGIGALLLDGIGDTIRVSLSAPPVEEVYAAKRILRAVGLDRNYAEVVACPTCGRCDWDCMAFAEKTEKYVQGVKKRLKIAVMGCVVNGPGEAADADVGVAGGPGGCVIFRRGEKPRKIDASRAEEEFFKEIDECLKRKE